MSWITTQSDGTQIEHLTCAETAELLRADLKVEFPGVKFRVRSETYSGGASIDVDWTGGPMQRAVKRVCQRWAGADFDGMQDLMIYRDDVTLPDGRLVSRGANFVFCERTPELLTYSEVNELVGELLGTSYYRPSMDTVI